MDMNKALKSGKKLTKTQIVNYCRNYSFYTWGAQKNFNKPIVVEKAQAEYFWDKSGNKYFDLTSQLVLNNIGFNHPHVIEAIKAQMDKFCYVAPVYATEIRAKAAKKLAEVTPGDLTKTFFTLGGADSNENAIKIAQLFTGKKKILTRYRSYHGGTYVAANAGGDPRRHHLADSTPWMVKFHLTDTMTSPIYKGKSQEQGDKIAFELLEQTIKYEDASTIAGIILEGYSGSSGVHQPGKTFWKSVRALCDKHNIMLIVDEVMSGFGRTGEWFGVNHYGITPDIMVMAKGLTGGHAPLGAVIVRKKIADYFESNNFQAGLTYSNHALSLAACLATIEVYEQEGLIKKAKTNGKYLGKRLKELAKHHPIIGDVRGTGMHWCLDLVESDGKTPLSPWNQPVNNKMKMIITEMRRLGLAGLSRWNWIFVCPPLTTTKKQIDEVVSKLDEALSSFDGMF